MSTMSVIVDYTNWRGERSKRTIQPVELTFGENQWHKEPQWLLEAIDLDDRDYRHKSFAMKNIHSWSIE